MKAWPVLLALTVMVAASAASEATDDAVRRLGLRVRLIDTIDCTDPADPHPFKDQGTSSVVDGPAGRYRVTAAHRHAFFSYRYRTAGRDRPVLLVVEYPDDAVRTMSFMTHDASRPGRPHLSFSQEGGVYTGPPLPLSNQMRTYTVLAWPQDDESPLIVANFDHRKGRAAASRITAYAIDGGDLPAIAPPDPARQRFIDLFFPLSFLMTRDNFGWRSPQSPQHLVDYCRLVGLNRVTLMVYANQTWGAMCTIPSWGAKEAPGPWTLDSVLDTLDRAGDLGLVAGIVATGRDQSGIQGMYGTIQAGGRDVVSMSPDELRRAVTTGLDEFLARYGRHRSLRGLSFGSMETIGFWELLNDRGVLADVVAHVKQQRPDLMVQTFFGNGYLQVPYFDGQRYPVTEAGVLAKWEQQGGSWPDFVGREAFAAWRRPPYRHDPVAARQVTGLTVFEMLHPDDHRLHPLYRWQPRAPIYYDVFRSRALSEAAGLDYAAVFATFTEGHLGLKSSLNFWHDKLWTAPDMNGPGPLAREPFATALGHRDRLGLSLGAWTCKTFGWEPHLRRFAAAYRALPPILMTDVVTPDWLRVRWVRWQNRRYVSCLSLVPFAAAAAVDGRAVALEPYDLVTWADDGAAAPQVTTTAPAAYVQFVTGRLREYRERHRQLQALDPAAAPPVYRAAADQAEQLLAAGQPHAADEAIGFGLAEELALRLAVLQRPRIDVPRTAAPPLDGELDHWPPAALNLLAETGDYLAGHVYFPTSWTGPQDLSLRLRLCHDGQRLYFGLDVRDDVAELGDQAALRFSPTNYRDWRSAVAKWETQYLIARPLGDGPGTAPGSTRRRPGGWLLEGSVPLSVLKVAPGGRIGFQVALADNDRSGNLAGHSWAVKQAMLLPHEPNFAFWQDARGLGELVLAR